MIRKLKILSLGLAAVFAMSAVGSPVSSAHVPATFDTTSGAAITASAVGEHTFTITGFGVTCAPAFHGTASSASPASISLQPTYVACGGGLAASYTGFGKPGEAGKCWYVFNADGSAALECNGGDVTIHLGPCVVHIPAQKFPLGSVSFATGSSGGKKDVTIDFKTGFKATHTDTFLCGFGSSGETSTGILEGKSTMTAQAGGSATDLGWTATAP